MKQDKHLISWEQKYEVKYICERFRDKNGVSVTVGLLKNIAKNLGINGRLSRSRKRVYIGLAAHGFKYSPIHSPKKK